MADDARRPTLRSRTTMSYAFEEALRPYLDTPAGLVPEIVRVVAEATRLGYRTIPTWTVSKRDAAPARRRGRR